MSQIPIFLLANNANNDNFTNNMSDRITVPVESSFRSRFAKIAKKNGRTVAAEARFLMEQHVKGNLALVNGPEMAMPSAAKASV